MLRAMAALCFLVACGDDGEAADAAIPDGSVPDAPALDAPVDAPVDARLGTIPDYESCEGFSSSDCLNPSSDCVRYPLLGVPPLVRQCIPRCDSTLTGGAAQDMCPVSTVCVPVGGGAGSVDYAPASNHCVPSTCGSASPVGDDNGTVGQPCLVGADLWLDALEPGQALHPGVCRGVVDGIDWGRCVETGAVAVGGACDEVTDRATALRCDSAGACVEGICRRTCDPRAVLSGGNGGCTGSGEACYDQSLVLPYSDGTYGSLTVGYCVGDAGAPQVACVLTAPTACASPAVCLPSNPVRPTGLCGTGTAVANVCDGDLLQVTCVETAVLCAEPGRSCALNPMTANATDRACLATACDPTTTPDPCAGAGLVCEAVSSSSPTIGFCRAVDCGAGHCAPLLWSVGEDGMSGTADDIPTMTFGHCQ